MECEKHVLARLTVGIIKVPMLRSKYQQPDFFKANLMEVFGVNNLGFVFVDDFFTDSIPWDSFASKNTIWENMFVAFFQLPNKQI